MLLDHYNNGCANAPHCYVIRTLPAVSHFFPMSPTSRRELTYLHRLKPSGFGATDDRVLSLKPTGKRNGLPIVLAVVPCSWTLRYFPAHTNRSVAGCARCVCQQQTEYIQCLVYTIFQEFAVISSIDQIIHLNNLTQRIANLQLL